MSRYLVAKHEYAGLRKEFGKQTLFQDVPGHLIDSISPNKDDQQCYMLRNPVNRFTQTPLTQSIHEVNTKYVKYHEQGINHTEGGWPKEIHIESEELRHRHCRRLLHDENYIRSVTTLSPVVQHYIDQNNAIEMYQTYFSGIRPRKPVEKNDVKISNIFQDPFQRPVTCVKWTNEKNPKIVVSYYPKNQNDPLTCYFWDAQKDAYPCNEIEPEHPCTSLACSLVDPEIIIAGLQNGVVKVFDIRQGTAAVSSSSIYVSHREAVTGVLFTHSRTNTDFYSSSSDGQCLWWDIRNLTEPTYQLPISINLSTKEQPSLDNALSVSCNQFDHGVPSKFLVGTVSGLVISGNRMGKSHNEILNAYWDAHDGPVRAIHRSPCTFRMFITCGDFTVRIWSEEIRTSPIIVSKPFHHQVTDVAWAPQRVSCYMSGCEGGFFYYWDLLRKFTEPSVTLKVSKNEIRKITPHSDGETIAVGDSVGSVYLLQLSKNMISSGPVEKAAVTEIYNRETKREHILDARVREIFLKKREEEAAAVEVESLEETGTIEGDDQNRITEEDYFKIVKEQRALFEDEVISDED